MFSQNVYIYILEIDEIYKHSNDPELKTIDTQYANG